MSKKTNKPQGTKAPKAKPVEESTSASGPATVTMETPVDTNKYPTWRYCKVNGEVQNKLFESGPIPKEWVDSPSKCE